MNAAIRRLTLAASVAGIAAMSRFSSVLAQEGQFGDTDIPGLPEPGNDPESYRAIIVDVITAVLNFLGLIAVVVVIIAGIRLIMSQGNDDAKEKAKKTIFYALAGLVIVLLARVIVGLITNYLAGQVA